MASTTADDVVELEAMRKEDSSWHPCNVSLSSSGVHLIIDYLTSAVEDIIVNAEEAFNRLRIRSLPLQEDDCSLIQQGDRVLAAQNIQSKSLFFDAEVEKALKVRHSKKVHCRCTFMIRWLHHNQNGGTLTVPSRSIMKLATKSIKAHPMISAFLITLKTLSCPDIPASPTLAVDIDSEMDLNALLEKQIEEINNLVDASKKKISPEILLEIGVDNKAQFQCTPVTASKVSKPQLQVPPDQNHLKRSTRSKTNLQREQEVKDPPVSSPSVKEEFSESRSPLNPLAARAAFASLMSNLPQNLELPFFNEEKNGCTNSSDNITHNKVVNSVILTVDTPSRALSKKMENENRASEITDSCAGFTCLGERKLSQPTKSTRLTRSTAKQGRGSHDGESNTDVEKVTTTRRFTRSKVHKEKEIHMVEDKQLIGEDISAIYTENSTNKNTGILESCVSKDKKSVSSPLDAEIESLPFMERSSPGGKKERKNCVEEAKFRNSTNKRRITRSALREEKGNETLEGKQGLEEDKLSQYTRSNFSEEYISIPESIVLATEEVNSSPLDAEVNLSPTEERSKKWQMSSSAKTTQKTEGKVGSNSKTSHGVKRKSTASNTQEVRFSPRLRFLPRTRSHHKS